jgi:uncharacterized small protein (DUF1192 family)
MTGAKTLVALTTMLRIMGMPRCVQAADLIEQQAAEIERLTAELELRRKSGSASERLHNLCEGIAKDADGSEWSREEWERLDAEMLELKKDNKRLTAERDALRAKLASVNWTEPQPGELPRSLIKCFGCEGFPSGDNNPCDVCGRSTAIDAARKDAKQ